MFNTKVRLLLIIIMLFNGILIRPTPVWGCSCVEPRPPEEAFVQADAVFVAQVTGDGNSLWDRIQKDIAQAYNQFVPPLPHTLVTRLYERNISFEVQDSWQGVATTQITVRTGQGGGDCGYGFQQDKPYLVYAHESPDGSLYTSICSRTAPLANAGEDLDYLQTVPKLELTNSPLVSSFQILGVGLLLVSAIALGVVIWRWGRRRKPSA